jgi:hypothetical protein
MFINDESIHPASSSTYTISLLCDSGDNHDNSHQSHLLPPLLHPCKLWQAFGLSITPKDWFPSGFMPLRRGIGHLELQFDLIGCCF